MRPQAGTSLFDHPGAAKLFSEKVNKTTTLGSGPMAPRTEGTVFHNKLWGKNVPGQDPNVGGQGDPSVTSGAWTGGTPKPMQVPNPAEDMRNRSQEQPFGANRSKQLRFGVPMEEWERRKRQRTLALKHGSKKAAEMIANGYKP